MINELPSQEKLEIVVMKFHSSQNLHRKARLNPNKTINPKFNTSPSPELGSSLKFTFKYPNKPQQKINVTIDIKITTNMVKVEGGSIRVSGGFVRMTEEGMYEIGLLLVGIFYSGRECLKESRMLAIVDRTFWGSFSSAIDISSLYTSEQGWIVLGSPKSITHFHDSLSVSQIALTG